MRRIGFAVAAMACAALAEPAMAQQRVAFDIAASPLDAALVHFARQSGSSVDATPLRPCKIRPAVDARF
jgi:hypothetical protein